MIGSIDCCSLVIAIEAKWPLKQNLHAIARTFLRLQKRVPYAHRSLEKLLACVDCSRAQSSNNWVPFASRSFEQLLASEHWCSRAQSYNNQEVAHHRIIYQAVFKHITTIAVAQIEIELTDVSYLSVWQTLRSDSRIRIDS